MLCGSHQRWICIDDNNELSTEFKGIGGPQKFVCRLDRDQIEPCKLYIRTFKHVERVSLMLNNLYNNFITCIQVRVLIHETSLD